jgi:hypothetical protein
MKKYLNLPTVVGVVVGLYIGDNIAGVVLTSLVVGFLFVLMFGVEGGIIGHLYGSRIYSWSKRLFSFKNVKHKLVSTMSQNGQRNNKPFVTGWVILFYLIIMGVVCFYFAYTSESFWLVAVGFLFWIFALRYFWTHARAIKDPDLAAIFRFGKLVSVASSGIIMESPFHELKLIDREEILIELPHQTMYAKRHADQNRVGEDRKFVEVEGKVYAVIQQGNSFEDISNSIELPNDPAQRLRIFEQIVSSHARIAVGKHSINELFAEQDTIEKEALVDLDKEINEKFGYHANEIGVSDFNEKAVVRADAVKIMAEARGVEVEAVARPLENNMGAAVYTSVSAFSGAFREVLMTWLGANRQEKTRAQKLAEKKSEETQSDMPSVNLQITDELLDGLVDKFAAKLPGFLGGRNA